MLAALRSPFPGISMSDPNHESWMELALAEASKAACADEVPVGAVAVLENRLVAADHNRSRELDDPTAHAEILVLRQAGRTLGNYRLSGLALYVTLEPCSMCAGAMIWARIENLVFGARDQKAGAVVSKASLLKKGRFNHNVPWRGGVLEERCQSLLQGFFRQLRS